MKSSIKATISAALLIGAGLWSVSPSGATPLTTPHGVNQAGQANSLYEPVRNRYKRPVWRYNYRYHGNRFGYRNGRYRYHYGGYYYSRPYWNYGPSFVIAPGYYGSGYDGYDNYYDNDYYDGGGYGGGYADSHVRWCLNRYRSYDVRSDTFVGYDGYRHRCRGPY